MLNESQLEREQNRKDLLHKIEEALKDLPIELQEDLLWVIEHPNLVEYLCKNSEMTAQEIKQYKDHATANDDHLMFVLLCAVEIYYDIPSEEEPQP